jgi:hypothetical protein
MSTIEATAWLLSSGALGLMIGYLIGVAENR